MMDTELSPDALSTGATRLRRRARQACMACHQRKRKCDVKRPCSMCVTYGYRCEYPKDERPSAYYVEPVSRVQSEDALGTLASVAHATSIAMTPTASDHDSRSKSPPPTSRGILDPFKSRYVSQNSAVAFPRSLGVDLQSTNPPPLHSFAWNCGIRPEESAHSHPDLLELISLDDFGKFSEVYFSTVHPIYALLDRNDFMQRCENYWSGTRRDLAFSGVIAGVVSLGSFFSLLLGHPQEAQIVSYAKGVLDDPILSRLPSTDQVIAFFLRTVYLRAMTRPHLAWLASCITVHVAEAIGLHHEADAILLTTDNGSQPIERDQEGAEQCRRLFWCVWTLNVVLSYEYGRSSVRLGYITCKQPKPISQGFTNRIIELAHLIPRDNSTASRGAQKADLQEAMEMLLPISEEHSFIILTKVDLCLCFYRRLRILKQGIDNRAVSSLITIGNKGLEAAYSLARQGHPWWNVLGGVFQYICVLLALDTVESLSNVAGALETLEKIVHLLRTHLAFEALTTAKVLIRDSAKKKRRELALLEIADPEDMTETRKDLDINWDELFDPSSNLFWMSSAI